MKNSLMSETLLRVNDHSLNVAEGPDNGPTLILLHGLGGSWRSFTPVLDDFISDFHLVGLDARGHGNSVRTPGAYTLRDYIEDTIAILELLSSEPTFLWGQSMGAMVFAAVAAKRPEMVKALILEDGPAKDDDTTSQVMVSMIEKFCELMRSTTSQDELKTALAKIELSIPGSEQSIRLVDLRGEEDITFLADCYSALDPEVYEFLLDGRFREEYVTDEYLKSILCPVLVLQANPLLGGAISDRFAAHMIEVLSNGQLAKFEEGNHNIHRSQPDQVTKVVKGFLQAIT